MFRKIKFRGANFYTGEWIYGDLKTLDSGEYMIVNEDTHVAESVIQESIGQYTGATFNGREVFEGDIFREGIEQTKTKVIWCSELSCFTGDENDVEILDGEVVNWDSMETPIFNVHEHN